MTFLLQTPPFLSIPFPINIPISIPVIVVLYLSIYLSIYQRSLTQVLMEKVENGQEGQGIKLFGKTILFQVKEEPLKSTSHDNNDIGEETSLEKRPDKIIPCPRCKSMETKFCYFNNYNVNQPRHFCKGCQRYWTAGGALRNVPIGAGRRKAKLPGLPGGFSDNVVFDHATGAYHVVGFVDGLALEEYWAQHNQQQFVVAGRGGGTGGVCGGFGPDFPAKRRRNMPYGQTNC